MLAATDLNDKTKHPIPNMKRTKILALIAATLAGGAQPGT
jgi:hypothetical protein